MTRYFALLYPLSLVLIAVTLPTKWTQANSIAILTSVGLWLLSGGLTARLQSLLRKPEILVLGCVYIAYAVSMFWTEDSRQGWKGLETRFSLLVFPLVMGSAPQMDRRWMQRILVSFVIAVVSISLLCLITTTVKNFNQGIYYSYNTSWLFSADPLVEEWGFHPSYFSMYCAFCIFIIAWAVWEKRLSFFVAVPGIAYLLFFQLMLASRAGILAVVLLGGASILYAAYLRKRLLVGIAILVLLCGVIGVGLFSFGTMKDKINAMLNRNVNIHNQDFRFTVRQEQWRASSAVILEHPLFGVGIGDTKTELLKKYKENQFELGILNSYDSHNLFVDAGVCAGVFGIIILLIQFGRVVMAAVKSRHGLYIQFVILYLSLAMVESSFSVQKGVVYFAFFNTLFYVFYFQHKLERKAPQAA